MKSEKLKNFFGIAWPFFGLAFFMVWGWIYVKPLLPDNFFSLDRLGEKLGGLFGQEEPIHPDERYDFFYSHADLKPKAKAELSFAGAAFSDEPASASGGNVIAASSEQELEQAIEAAQDGDLIELQAGEYRLNLEISKNLSLGGQGRDTVLLPADDNYPIISVSSSAFSLENLRLKSGRAGITAENAELNIKNVSFSGLSATACHVFGTKLEFRNNKISNCGTGIKALESSGEITRSVISGNAKSGVEIRGGRFSVKENIIERNGSYGLFADARSEVAVADNYIDDNTGFQTRLEKEKKIYR